MNWKPNCCVCSGKGTFENHVDVKLLSIYGLFIWRGVGGEKELNCYSPLQKQIDVKSTMKMNKSKQILFSLNYTNIHKTRTGVTWPETFMCRYEWIGSSQTDLFKVFPRDYSCCVFLWRRWIHKNYNSVFIKCSLYTTIHLKTSFNAFFQNQVMDLRSSEYFFHAISICCDEVQFLCQEYKVREFYILAKIRLMNSENHLKKPKILSY